VVAGTVADTAAGTAGGQDCLRSSRGLRIAHMTEVFQTERIEGSTSGTDRSMRYRYDVGS
jgi:hypothetical protein